MKIVEFKTKADADRNSIIFELNRLLRRTGDNEVEGLMVTIRTAEGYEYIRIGFTYIEAIGMLDRHKHAMHTAWDEEPKP